MPTCRKFPSANKSSLRRVVMRYNSVRKFPTQCTIEDWPSMVMNQTTARGGLDWIVPRVNNKYQDINLEYWDRLE